MGLRRDALAGAARVVLALRAEARSSDDMTANVGQIRVEPGGANVVPGLAELSIDVRSPTDEGFARVEALVHETLDAVATEEGLELDVVPTQRKPPVALAEEVQRALERAAEAEGATHARMPSGAGHDAMILGTHVPAGMLFVPSRGGVSHNPEEYTAPYYCDLGARVLSRAVAELTSRT